VVFVRGKSSEENDSERGDGERIQSFWIKHGFVIYSLFLDFESFWIKLFLTPEFVIVSFPFVSLKKKKDD
jgi:hypothetical protein